MWASAEKLHHLYQLQILGFVAVSHQVLAHPKNELPPNVQGGMKASDSTAQRSTAQHAPPKPMMWSTPLSLSWPSSLAQALRLHSPLNSTTTARGARDDRGFVRRAAGCATHKHVPVLPVWGSHLGRQ
jgi:hypothetical protein